MKRKHKKLGIIVVFIIVAIVILTFVINTIIERKVETAISELPESVKVEYAAIHANIWSGNLTLTSPRIEITGEITNKIILDAKLNTLEINDISYWDFLFNDEISLNTLAINELVATYKHNPVVKNDDYKSSFLDKIKQTIQVETISITNADILVKNYETDSILLSVPKLNFELFNLQLNSNASKGNKKISYNDFILNAEDLKWATNAYDDLFAESIHITNTEATLKGFKLKTKYNTAEFSSLLKKERDHFNLNIKEMKFSDMDFGFNDAEQFYFNSKQLVLNSAKAEIYRDKLVADDETIKSLYSKMLRELNFNLGLNTVEINEGSISYLEKVKIDEPAGRLDFTNMKATISNLGNIYGNDDTLIHVNCTFMENSPLEVHWSFKVADLTDQFVFKADLGFLNAAQMDQFTQPNLHVDLNGELKQTYLTISGNPKTSRIDLKVKYEDFKIAILKKDGKEKNKLLSGIVNLFISKDSEDEKENYRYGQSQNIERDATKSVFNFVWLNIKEALLSAMTGDGIKAN